MINNGIECLLCFSVNYEASIRRNALSPKFPPGLELRHHLGDVPRVHEALELLPLARGEAPPDGVRVLQVYAGHTLAQLVVVV